MVEKSLSSLEDEELTDKIQHLMWQAARSRDRSSVLPELEKCYQETVQRQKVHLWQRAKACYLAQR